MASTSGRDKWAAFVHSANPLRLAAEGIPDALGNLATMGLVVASSRPVRSPMGAMVFVALAWFDDASIPKHAFRRRRAPQRALFALAALRRAAEVPTDTVSQEARDPENSASAANAFSVQPV